MDNTLPSTWDNPDFQMQFKALQRTRYGYPRDLRRDLRGVGRPDLRVAIATVNPAAEMHLIAHIKQFYPGATFQSLWGFPYEVAADQVAFFRFWNAEGQELFP